MIPTCHDGDNICWSFALEVPMRKGVVLHALVLCGQDGGVLLLLRSFCVVRETEVVFLSLDGGGFLFPVSFT